MFICHSVIQLMFLIGKRVFIYAFFLSHSILTSFFFIISFFWHMWFVLVSLGETKFSSKVLPPFRNKLTFSTNNNKQTKNSLSEKISTHCGATTFRNEWTTCSIRIIYLQFAWTLYTCHTCGGLFRAGGSRGASGAFVPIPDFGRIMSKSWAIKRPCITPLHFLTFRRLCCWYSSRTHF